MTNDQMVNWVHHFEEVRLSNKAKEKMMKSQQLVLELLHSHQTVYGVNTGFGSLSTEKINENDRPFHDDKKKLTELINNGVILSSVESIIGSLQ